MIVPLVSRTATCAISRLVLAFAVAWSPMTNAAAGVTGADVAPQSSRFNAADISRVDRLLALVQRKLDQAPLVAEAKWASMTRIEDSEGEERAIEEVRTRAARAGVDTIFAVRFARAQIDAGKSIQAARHKQWTIDSKTAPKRTVDRAPAEVAYQAPAPITALTDAELRMLRDAAVVLRRQGSRRLLDSRAADLIQVGGADLLASQVALQPLYELAN